MAGRAAMPTESVPDRLERALKDPEFLSRFWGLVDRQDGGFQTGGCWPWLGSTTGSGYGQIRYGGHLLAHRIAYVLRKGDIPTGLQLDHLCRNRSCVNPAHLEPVTGRENPLRGGSPTAVNAFKTHCPQGHEYTV